MHTDAIYEAFNTLMFNPSDRHAAARLLEILADEFGDSRYRRAAGALRGRFAGRKMRDDQSGLATISVMLERGDAPNVWQAANLVARSAVGERSIEATAKRLARKFSEARPDI